MRDLPVSFMNCRQNDHVEPSISESITSVIDGATLNLFDTELDIITEAVLESTKIHYRISKYFIVAINPFHRIYSWLNGFGTEK